MKAIPDTVRSPPPPPKKAAGHALASRQILGMRVDCTRYAGAVEKIVELATQPEAGVVCVASTHMVMESRSDPSLRRTINAADLVTSDGMPLVWALRALGLEGAERVYGPTLTSRLCERAQTEHITVGFYGGTPEVLDALEANLRHEYPDLEINFLYPPPFRELSDEEDRAVVSAIEDSEVGILFVGLGCPKQEHWMATHRDQLSCVMVGVGAAFDFLAGAKAQAPAWMQASGLEWLFRLLSEPRRLWRRYLVINPRFIWQFGRQWWIERRSRPRWSKYQRPSHTEHQGE